MLTKTIKDREADFSAEIFKYRDEYGIEMINEFFLYWTEPNKSKTKMKFELEKTWDTSRRLLRWKKNNTLWNGTHKRNDQQNGFTKEVLTAKGGFGKL